MAEHDYVIANQNGANTRSDLNNALAAIVSNNSKASAPTTTYAFMWWADTANDILKQRNGADSAWISILTLSTGAPLATIANFTSTGIDDNATSTKLTIDSAGSLLVNRTASATNGQKLFVESDNFVMGVSGTNATGELIRFFGNGGSVAGTVSHSGTSVAYNTSSDYRLKENVVPMTGSIDRLKDLKPSRFNFKADADTTVDGFLAHEAQVVVPECATGIKDAMVDEEYEVTPAVMDGDTVVTEAVMGTRSVPDYQGIDQSKLVPLLVASLQEAVAKIEALEARVTALEV